MIRLNLAYFYNLNSTFAQIDALAPDTSMGDVWITLYQVETTLQAMFASDNVISESLRVTRTSANALYEALTELKPRSFDTQYTRYDHARLTTLTGQFRTNLLSELSILNAYIVTAKGAFDPYKLVSQAESAFPPDLPLKVPEAVSDLREAGKCIAFEMPQAAAFHLFRAVEVIVRRYWEVTTGNKPKPRSRTLGVFIAALEKEGCANPKVLAAMRQLNDLHRNPLIHPEDTLNVEQSISLLGMTRSLAEAMLDAVPQVTTEAPPPDGETLPSSQEL